MVFYVRSLAQRSIFFLVPKRPQRFIYTGIIRYVSTLSNVPLVSSFETGNNTGHQEGRYESFRTEPEVNVVIANISAGSSEDEVFQSLLYNRTCNSIEISHNLVHKLLLCFANDWRSALGVFRWVQSRPDYKPLPECYDMVVDILGKMKQMEKMIAVVQEMRNDNLISLNTIAKVMRRLCGAGKWKGAMRMFDELGSYGLEKNTETMNVLLDTLCKEKKVEQAREVFLKLKSYIPPNANTFNMFIYGWCKINRVEEAYWTIQEMKGYGCRPCVISYSIIILSYCKQFNFDKVFQLLDEMKAEGCPPNVFTFTTIMSSLTKSQDYKKALQIPERMKSAGCQPDTLFYNTYIHTLGRAGLVKEAIRVFKVEMPSNGATPYTSTYNSMIAMFSRQAEQEKAIEFLRDLENSPHCKPDIQSYSPLLKLCFNIGKIDTWLRQMLDDMVNKHHLSLDLATYTLLIHGLCKAKKYIWAYLLFKEMIGKDIKPRYQTCRLLLDEMKQNNMYEAAESIEGLMKKLKSS